MQLLQPLGGQFAIVGGTVGDRQLTLLVGGYRRL